MSNEEENNSRRNFIKRSAGVIGAMGLGMGIDPDHVAAEIGPTSHGPDHDFPWGVNVDSKARLMLHLLAGPRLTVQQILFTNSLSQIYEHMHRRVTYVMKLDEDDAEKIAFSSNLGGAGSLPQLCDAIHAVINSLDGASHSYTAYARGAQSWPGGLKDALLETNNMITAPLLRLETQATKQAVDGVLNAHGSRLERFSTDFTTEELFTKSKEKFTRRRELKVIKKARDVGLLWCQPRGQYKVENNELVYPLQKANDKRCTRMSTGVWKCTSGYEGEYCEEVDGSCTPMST